MATALHGAARAARGARSRRAGVARARPCTAAPARGCSTATEQQGLEGVVAKRAGLPLRARAADRRVAEDQAHAPPGAGDRRLDARARGGARERIGALLMGYYDGDGDASRYAGRVGHRLHRADARRAGARSWSRCARRAARSTPRRSCPRNAVFVEPELVAEIEFREWTREGVMRAPVVQGAARRQAGRARSSAARDAAAGRRPWRRARAPGSPEALFDEVRGAARDGALDGA